MKIIKELKSQVINEVDLFKLMDEILEIFRMTFLQQLKIYTDSGYFYTFTTIKPDSEPIDNTNLIINLLKIFRFEIIRLMTIYPNFTTNQ